MGCGWPDEEMKNEWSRLGENQALVLENANGQHAAKGWRSDTSYHAVAPKQRLVPRQ
jgi:hypothetical protein